MKKHLLYILIALLFVPAFHACKDDDLVFSPEEEEDPYKDELSINFVVTLDNMGGSMLGYNPMQEIENYIDPQKFRVFFFDSEEKFLFESKSRWVKKLGSTSDYTNWLVSVPFYTTGNENDDRYQWNWDFIRTKLTTGAFRIAIVANAPTWECFPDLDGQFSENRKFLNDGPYWTKYNTEDPSIPAAKRQEVKRMIDFHHCQNDPIYTSKSKRNGGSDEGFYDFLMAADPTVDASDYDHKWLMSPTACWVDHGPNYGDDGFKSKLVDDKGKAVRTLRLPSKEYPIPMYGCRYFDKIPPETWIKGTPFNLSAVTEGYSGTYNTQSISLLRCAVKLELLIPKAKGYPDYLSLRYSNVYSRVHPMNVWTSTDSIWFDDCQNDCEWSDILNYGPITRKGDPSTSVAPTSSEATNFKEYRDRISWLYGEWSKIGPGGVPRWKFNDHTSVGITLPGETNNTGRTRYPKVFNPCIQRNGILDTRREVNDYTSYFNDNYYHIIVYTGERNVNDPSTLGDMAKNGSGAPTVMHWNFAYGTDLYCLPMVDYKNYTKSGSGATVTLPYKLTNGFKSTDTAHPTNKMGKDSAGFEVAVMDAYNTSTKKVNTNIIPIPLLRNHVYRIRLDYKGNSDPGASVKAPSSRSDDEPEFTITSEEFKSPTISFRK